MSERYDVVIVGGGAVGSSSAFFLANDPGFTGKVLVIERDPTYATASTPLSLGGIRQQFSTPENALMSMFGAHFVADVAQWLSVDGEAPTFSYREGGYLFLASETGAGILRANHELQISLGAKNVLLTPAELAARFPWLNTEGLALGCLGLKHEGWVDPYGLLQAFKKKARSLGVTYLTDEVVGVDRDGARITGVRLASGKTIACGTMVNAAGPHAGKLAAMAGVELPVVPKKRFIYVIDCRADVDCRQLMIDTTGVFVRPEGAGFVCGVSPPEDQDPDSDDLEIEYEMFDDVVWPTLANRIPAFAEIKMTRAWAGHYDYNTLDQNGIIGRHPEVANLVFANGFSGHGLQQSPATGRAVSELIVHGGFRSLDLARFGYERIQRGEALKEANVV